jgi:hypothetical protein
VLRPKSGESLCGIPGGDLPLRPALLHGPLDLPCTPATAQEQRCGDTVLSSQRSSASGKLPARLAWDSGRTRPRRGVQTREGSTSYRFTLRTRTLASRRRGDAALNLTAATRRSAASSEAERTEHDTRQGLPFGAIGAARARLEHAREHSGHATGTASSGGSPATTRRGTGALRMVRAV